jgi:Zn-dependent membrane protease YugP
MMLLEKDAALADMCRRIESAIGEDSRCQGLQVSVSLMAMDSLPESAMTDVFRDGGAAYRPSTREVLIDPVLLTIDPSVTIAVLAHEVGHAVAPMPETCDGKKG